MWNNQKQKKMFSLLSNLETYYHFKLDFQKSGPTYRGQVVNDDVTIGCWWRHNDYLIVTQASEKWYLKILFTAIFTADCVGNNQLVQSAT